LLADLIVPDVVARRAPRLAPSGTYPLADLESTLSAAGFTPQQCTAHAGLWYRILVRR
jgi:hypothetical protein